MSSASSLPSLWLRPAASLAPGASLADGLRPMPLSPPHGEVTSLDTHPFHLVAQAEVQPPATPPSPCARVEHATLHDPLTQDLLLLSGRCIDRTHPHHTQTLADFWRLSFETGEWELLDAHSQLPPRCGHSFTLVGDTIAYVFGGTARSGSHLSDLFRVDISARCPEFAKVRAANAPPRARHGHAAAAVKDEFLFVCSGTSATGGMDDCWALDVRTHFWRPLGPRFCLPRPLSGAAAATGGGHLFLIGGRSGGAGEGSARMDVLALSLTLAASAARRDQRQRAEDAPALDPSAWTTFSRTTRTTPAPRTAAAVVALSSELLLLTGGRRIVASRMTVSTELADAYIFHLPSRQWHSFAALAACGRSVPSDCPFGARAGHTLTLCNNGCSLFLAGGTGGTAAGAAVGAQRSTMSALLFEFGFGGSPPMRPGAFADAHSISRSLGDSNVLRTSTMSSSYVGCHFGIAVDRAPLLVGNLDILACVPLQQPATAAPPFLGVDASSHGGISLAHVDAEAVACSTAYDVAFHGVGETLVEQQREQRLAQHYLLPWLRRVRVRLGSTQSCASPRSVASHSSLRSVTSLRCRGSSANNSMNAIPALSSKAANFELDLPTAAFPLKDDARCFSCDQLGISRIAHPCGHFALCANCAAAVTHCPLCNALVESVAMGMTYRMGALHDLLLKQCNEASLDVDKRLSSAASTSPREDCDCAIGQDTSTGSAALEAAHREGHEAEATTPPYTRLVASAPPDPPCSSSSTRFGAVRNLPGRPHRRSAPTTTGDSSWSSIPNHQLLAPSPMPRFRHLSPVQEQCGRREQPLRLATVSPADGAMSNEAEERRLAALRRRAASATANRSLRQHLLQADDVVSRGRCMDIHPQFRATSPPQERRRLPLSVQRPLVVEFGRRSLRVSKPLKI